MTEEKTINNDQEKEMGLFLDKIYTKVLDGIPKVSLPVDELARDYISKNPDVEIAAKSLIKYQIAKCTTSGFLTGLGGVVTMPVTIPANVSNVLYVQMRMIASVAYLAGYDVKSDQVKTLVYVCLAGVSIDNILKNVGINAGEKLAMNLIKKIPGATLTKINQKVAFRLVTKFGSKGVINLGRMVPFVGGVIGGGFDYAETKLMAKRAYTLFIKGDMNSKIYYEE